VCGTLGAVLRRHHVVRALGRLTAAWGVVAMMWLVLAAIAVSMMLGACATTSGGAEAVRGVRSSLVAVDIVAETTAPIVAEARRVRIDQCRARDLPTAEQRESCMGPLAQPLAPTAAEAAAAYDQAVDALERLEAALRELERMKAAAEQVTRGTAP
jgi:uncharacterized protein YhaN